MLASHPVPGFAVTVIGLLLAVGIGLPAGRVALFTVALFLGQLSIGWSNDRIDAARDTANARTDKPAATGDIAVSTLTVAMLVSVALSVLVFFLLGWRCGLVALALNGAGWSYNLGLKATVFSGLTYLVGPGLLPVVAYLAASATPPWWAPVAGGLLGHRRAHRQRAARPARGRGHRRARPAAPARPPAGHRGDGDRARRVLAGRRARPRLAHLPVLIAAALAVLLAGTSAVLGLRRPNSPLAFYAALGVALIDVVLFVVVI